MRRIIMVIAATIMASGLAGAGVAHAGSDRHTTGSVEQAVVQEVSKQDVGVLAVAQNGLCEVGEVCLFYNAGCSGSLADFSSFIPDFAGYRFLSPGSGQGQAVKNNAASARNRDAVWIARIHYNENYGSVYDDVLPGNASSCRNLVNTLNDNASLTWRQ
ncbi:peptidase inhibitor family I36 protein [Actinoalloteichus sp. GBA129-24]|uniref:peptidase inhibitor family I36 protein n=1 Tax=Actinoalloteichus sp. GBA129-24 TaxID=1612551 RepID=UPI0009507211|nr:peptidase inhibitor family I36 protein [Actinoalloteichus sp. GBA129-24]APU21999.1 hypothetical protein UA75_20050 [Actinoalloteichus sp. GBA129-24]